MGSLREAIERQTAHALACGALHPIETAHTVIDDGGVRFAVRVAANLARKEAARLTPQTQPPRDPFLPYEPDLFVADMSPTHVALLNKFNVIDRHLLIVTRRFEPQEALLDIADFNALVEALSEIDGLAFYNGGAAAGASQPHKHLQMVPLPLEGGEGGPSTPGHTVHQAPIDAILDSAQTVHGARPIATVPRLRFRHAFARLDPGHYAGPGALTSNDVARVMLDCYRALLDAVDVPAVDVDGVAHQGAPYNLLVTRRWMLVVPRTAECVEGISVNSLGFAGSFFVRNAAQLQTLAQLGPMTALERVSVSRET
jgi:sulfate adenylyltransferase (ADP) / ATP adenylyltransferase